MPPIGKLLPLLLVFLAFGCSSQLATMKRQLLYDYSEQLYVDAPRGFAIKHPLAWQREEAAAGMDNGPNQGVRWQIRPVAGEQQIGEMRIISLAGEFQTGAQAVLETFRAPPYPSSPQAYRHPAGEALRLVEIDLKTRRNTIALEGRQRDFVISFTYPQEQHETLQPIVHDVLSSFTEIDADPKGR